MTLEEAKKKFQKKFEDNYAINGICIADNKIMVFLTKESNLLLPNYFEGYFVEYQIIGKIEFL